MDRDFLRNFGLEENQINSILDENSKDIGKKVNEINSLNQQIEKLNEEVKTANGTINTLKNSNKDNESLQQKIAEYKTKIDTMSKEFEAERKNNAIISELQNNDFIDPKLVIHLIDTDKVIKAQDGSYTGLTEQIDALLNNSQYDYLRKTETQEPEETVPAPEVDRGGYNPELPFNQPEQSTDKEKEMIGAVVGQGMMDTAKANQESAESFWNARSLV